MSTRSALSRATRLARRTLALARDSDVSLLAAGVAYYAFVSLLPAVLLALVVASAVGGENLTAAVLAATGDLLTDTGREVIESALTSSPERGTVTIIGLVLLIWGTLKVFRALDTAFSRIYAVGVRETFLESVTDAVIVAVGGGVALGLMLGLGAIALTFPVGVLTRLLGIVVLPVALTAAFLPMYLRFPDVEIGVAAAVPGAAFAAVGWTVLQAGFQLYVRAVGGGAFGVLGAVVLLVTWLYVGAAVVLVGTAVNVVLARERGESRPEGAPRERAAQPRAAGERVGPTRLGDAEEGLDGEAAPGAAAGVATDRQAQGPGSRRGGRMAGERDSGAAPDVSELAGEVEELRGEFEAFADDVEERTVDKPDLEAELKRYVRKRLRRGHARGWGPYLVLAYGVVLSLGAFYWLDGWPAVAAMVVTFTSTLGLYVLFLLVGAAINVLGLGERAASFVRERRR